VENSNDEPTSRTCRWGAVTATTTLGLDTFQWVALVAAVLALLIIAEAWLGHYRSGFPLRAQYAPLLSGGLLAVVSVAAVIMPDSAGLSSTLRIAGWIAVATGMIGVGYHHWYGIVEKAGGYRWLLHYLMYGAPQLAPLALSATGALAIVASQGLARGAAAADPESARLLLGIAAIALAGAIAQTGILHYRGAFNTPLMYAPFSLPPLAVLGSGWLAVDPSPGITGLLRVCLWGTIVLAFVGLGMHLRGIDRQMGGMHVLHSNILQGPPPLAPAVYAGFAIIALLALGLRA
jgi:hypothetical protein